MQTLEAIDGRYKVPHFTEGHESEFEVQANLYAALKARGWDVRGEVGWYDPVARCRCRFDLVVYDAERKPVHILEVKRCVKKHKSGVENTRQGRRYRLFGVPVTFIYGSGDSQEFLDTFGSANA